MEHENKISKEQEERIARILKNISKPRRDFLEGLATAFEAVEAQERASA